MAGNIIVGVQCHEPIQQGKELRHRQAPRSVVQVVIGRVTDEHHAILHDMHDDGIRTVVAANIDQTAGHAAGVEDVRAMNSR